MSYFGPQKTNRVGLRQTEITIKRIEKLKAVMKKKNNRWCDYTTTEIYEEGIIALCEKYKVKVQD